MYTYELLEDLNIRKPAQIVCTKIISSKLLTFENVYIYFVSLLMVAEINKYNLVIFHYCYQENISIKQIGEMR